MELEPEGTWPLRGRRPAASKGRGLRTQSCGPQQPPEGVRLHHPTCLHPLVFQKEFEQLMFKNKGYEEEEAGPLLWGHSQPMLSLPRPLSLLTAPSTRKVPTPHFSESGKWTQAPRRSITWVVTELRE